MRPGTLVAMIILLAGLALMLAYAGTAVDKAHEQQKGRTSEAVRGRDDLAARLEQIERANTALSTNLSVVRRELEAVRRERDQLAGALQRLASATAAVSATGAAASATKPEVCSGLPTVPPP